MNNSDNFECFLKDTLLEILEIKELSNSINYYPNPHIVNNHTLFYFTKGKADVIINEKSFHLTRTSIFLLTPGMKFNIKNSTNYPMQIYCLEFNIFRIKEQSLSHRLFEKDLSFPISGLINYFNQRSQRLFKLLILEYQKDESKKKYQYESYLRELLENVLYECSMPVQGTPEDIFSFISSYIQNNFHKNNIKLEKLAAISGLHPTYFSQLFKSKMNKSPIDFLNQVRMNKAKELLINSNQTVREIAHQVGYQDEFYFSRRFKKNSGYAPTLYKKRKKVQNIISLSFPYTEHLFALDIVPVAGQIHPSLPNMPNPLSLPYHGADPWGIKRQVFVESKPDLILCKENVVKQARENIGDIAPIIPISWTHKDMIGHLKEIAEIVDKNSTAKNWIDLHEKKVEDAYKTIKSRISEATVTVCQFVQNGFRIYGTRNIGHVFYRSLQFSPSERLQMEIVKKKM